MMNFNHDLLIDLVKNKISNDQFAIRTIGVGATIDAINITEINGFGSQRPRYFYKKISENLSFLNTR